jgi:hypothetical protein
MSGFTVPNATDFGTGVIASLDQAEPDSLDFSTIGDRRHGVISGADVVAVTSAAGDPIPAYLNVVLDNAEIRIGTVYQTIATASVVIPLADTSGDPRFDIIVAYNNSGTFQYDVVSGVVSATNPIFPTLTDDQIPLYAVYVKNTFNTSYTTELLVDKRVFAASSLARTGTGIPSSGLGNVGDLYISSTLPGGVGQSQAYVKVGASSWINIPQYINTVSANTPSTIVFRDASGNFAAGTITATTFSGSGASLTSIPGSALVSGAVGTTQLANGAVTTDKLAAGAPRAGYNSTRNVVTASSYTLVASDLGKLVELNNASAVTLTIPTDSVSFTEGDRIDIIQTGAGQVTLTPGSGVTLNSDSGKRKLLSQWAACTVIKRGANSWVAIGNLTE